MKKTLTSMHQIEENNKVTSLLDLETKPEKKGSNKDDSKSLNDASVSEENIQE